MRAFGARNPGSNPGGAIKMSLESLFGTQKPIIGMIHLAGRRREKLRRAEKELNIYSEEGIDAAIIEDYHGTPRDVKNCLEMVEGREDITIGVNLLRNPYRGIELASRYGAGFVQFDNIQTEFLDLKEYTRLRKSYPQISVLGGVRFKYQKR